MIQRALPLIMFAAIGFILGVVLGHAVGVNIRSDNLPFFDALGAVVGLAAGLVTASVLSRRSGGGV